jgi:N-acetyl-gamma-glutamyl-phosphate reductase
MQKKQNVGILGATGYTGLELVRLLLRHPAVELQWITSENSAGKKLSTVSNVRCDLELRTIKAALQSAPVDFVFVCLPHTEAMAVIPQLLKSGSRVIDLSADFRIKSTESYQHWYGHKHTAPELLEGAVYGLSELRSPEIAATKILANPGCYPTSVLLPLLPIVSAGVKLKKIIIDSKSSISGAGRSAKVASLFCEVNENFYPYAIGHKHRHVAEIEEQLSLAANHPISVTFSPHVVPINRGILSTIYLESASELRLEEVLSIWNQVYLKSKFVQVLGEDRLPSVSACAGSNLCQIAVTAIDSNNLIITSAIDNLLKGASGQALQNFNIMAGYPEDTALI